MYVYVHIYNDSLFFFSFVFNLSLKLSFKKNINNNNNFLSFVLKVHSIDVKYIYIRIYDECVVLVVVISKWGRAGGKGGLNPEGEPICLR